VVDQPDAAPVADKALHYYARFDQQIQQRLRPMVTPELIEEHRTNPLGFHGLHSFELQFVQNYLRTRPQAGKYVIVAVEAWKDYRIGVLSGVRGVEPEVLDQPRFSTEEEAMHGVFLARVRDILGVEV
jgi:hypothetical protein